MFNGIVEAKGSIQKITSLSAGVRALIRTPKKLKTLKPGSSIAVNGACLTVSQRKKDAFWVDISLETLQKTFFKKINVGDIVNLERSKKFSDRVDGHFVTGHVDVTGRILKMESFGEFLKMKIQFPSQFSSYLVEKGSVAVDGISLTVNQCDEDSFEVMLIPETLKRTNLAQKKNGDPVHLEFDILGKYVQKLTNVILSAKPQRDVARRISSFKKRFFGPSVLRMTDKNYGK